MTDPKTRITMGNERACHGDGEDAGTSLAAALSRAFRAAGFPLEAWRVQWNAAIGMYEFHKVES